MTRLGHSPECKCDDCSIVATRRNIEKLERTLFGDDALDEWLERRMLNA